MRKIFCFLDGQDNLPKQLASFIEELDSSGDEVYMYTNVCDQAGIPSDVLYAIDTIVSKDVEKAPYIFLSNVSNLFQIIYRLYHQIFDAFVYYQQNGVREYPLSGAFQTIFLSKISDEEMLFKPIYTNYGDLAFQDYKCEIRGYESLTDPKNNIDISHAKDLDCNLKSYAIVRKYYYINELYYLFEPVYTDQRVVICNLEGEEGQLVSNVEFTFPGYEKILYMYFYNEELLNKLFALLNNISNNNLAEIENALESIEEEMKGYFSFVSCMTCCILEDAIELDKKKAMKTSLLLLSFLVQVTSRPQYINQLLECAIESRLLSSENKYFLWNQCKRYLFTDEGIGDSSTGLLMDELYRKVYKEYEDQLATDLYPILKENRNDNLIIIFTTQFLSERHAPTRTALERCYTLSKELNKNILLINTREQLSRLGMTLIYHPMVGLTIEDYSDKTQYQYKDLSIPFYQPREPMPSVLVIQEMIKMIRELKPSFIFCIGGSSIVADLCGKVVPEASIGTVFSSIPTTVGTFSVIGRKIEESEWNKISKIGIKRGNVIESTFTFELSQRKRTITRDDISIPKNKFVLVTVGTRLDADINEEFIETIQTTFPWGTHIIFAGYFSKYEYFCSIYPELKDNSTYIGYYDDMLALMEICDLYVNPRRFGGGFSIVEAFHEGTPGVTVRMGDVAVAAGDDFCVNNYKEMLRVMKRYIEDAEFYRIMSQKAREREKVVTDSASAMDDIINKIQGSPLFF